MEQLLFYRYLDFQREQFSDIGEKIKRIPIHIRVLFSVAIISMVVCIYTLMRCSNRWISVLVVILELVCAFACSIFTEKYCIKNSKTQMERYWEYCVKLKAVLADANIHTLVDIAEMKVRLEKQVQDMRTARHDTNAFIGKLAEIMAVPVILSIITTCIGKMDNIGEMVAVVMVILSAAGAIFATVLVGFNFFRFPHKQKMEQMIAFCDDLQGVLDLERFGTDVHNRNSDEK